MSLMSAQHSRSVNPPTQGGVGNFTCGSALSHRPPGVIDLGVELPWVPGARLARLLKMPYLPLGETLGNSD